MTKLRGLLACCVGLVLAMGAGASAQAPSVDAIEADLRAQSQRIDAIQQELDRGTLPAAALSDQLQALLDADEQSRSDAKTLDRAAEEVEARLLALGSPPSAGEPPESNSIAALRRQLTEDEGRLSGLSKMAALNSADTTSLVQLIEDKARRARFVEITARATSPLLPSFWSDAARELRPSLGRLVSGSTESWRAQSEKNGWSSKRTVLLVALFFAIALLLLPLWPTWRRMEASFEGKPQPTLSDKTLRVALKSLSRAFVAVGAGALLYVAGLEAGLFDPTTELLARRLWLAGSAWTLLWTFARAVFSPELPAWRLVDCDDANARRLRNLLVAGVSVLVLERVVGGALELEPGATGVALAMRAVTTAAFAVLLWLFVKPSAWDSGTATTAEPHSRKRVWQRSGQVLSVVLLILLGLGYVRLASFVFHRAVFLFLFVVLFWCVHRAALWAVSKIPSGPPRPTRINDGQVPSAQTEEAHSEPIGFWLRIAVEILLGVLAVPAFMLIFGFEWVDARRVSYWVSSDINVGAVSVSFEDIVTAAAAFLIVNTGTRWATNLLGRTLLRGAPIEDGARNSIVTLLNYVGLVIAILVALSIAGIGFAKLAIIAGALSVGIGFGLQNIVNNFVSGLILLFERPVKAGDWIVVQSGSGYVKRIGVRATEIQTPDRASIIVPNSELVSSSVENWSHGDRLGRIFVSVGVAYGSDPNLVRDLLLQCANDHASVLSSPPADVLFSDFGDSSLNFVLRAYLRDYNNHAFTTVKSEVRYSIFAAFQKAGIVIPFPQRDLHVYADLPKPAGAAPETKELESQSGES